MASVEDVHRVLGATCASSQVRELPDHNSVVRKERFVPCGFTGGHGWTRTPRRNGWPSVLFGT